MDIQLDALTKIPRLVWENYTHMELVLVTGFRTSNDLTQDAGFGLGVKVRPYNVVNGTKVYGSTEFKATLNNLEKPDPDPEREVIRAEIANIFTSMLIPAFVNLVKLELAKWQPPPVE